jgi:tRNA dimethylallyltransferase
MRETEKHEDGRGAPGGPFAGQSCPAIVGPTAVGKTGLVTSLASRLPIEVISLDSRQIYQGMRIGTAQPTAGELASCPHHLIDFISPTEKYDAIRFRRDFERVYAEVKARGGVPILAGGAGMYLTALREGFLDIPGSSPETLAQVRKELDPLSLETIRSRLAAVDPASVAGLHPNDRYRLQRALEIHRISGISMSDLKARQQPDPALDLQFPTFVLERDVPALDERITQRTRDMLAEGWIAETEAVLKTHPPLCPGLMSIGYREIVRFLQGELDRDRLEAQIILVTRQYAKRQRTWFRQVDKVWNGSPEAGELPDLITSTLD